MLHLYCSKIIMSRTAHFSCTQYIFSAIFTTGYDVKVAEKALIATSNKGVQPAMDWYVFCDTVFI